MDNRQKVVDIITSWIGAKKGDSTHKYIVDQYNSIKPLPNGYKLKYTDHWCAGTASSAYHCAGLDNLFPASASCSDMINKAKKMGIWVENDAHIPKKADAVLYDWDDGKNYATTDCVGAPEHVGLVTDVKDGYIYVVEGNIKNPSQVGTRKLAINGRYIRGFVTPKFDGAVNSTPAVNKPVEQPKTNAERRNLQFGCKGSDVKELHKVLRTYKYGVSADNDLFDMLTKSCILHFQKSHGLEVDGIVGKQTYKALGM